MAKHRRHVRSFSYSHCIDDDTKPPSLSLHQKVVGWVPEKKSLGTVRYFDRTNKCVKRGMLCEDGISISAPDGVFDGVEGWMVYSRSFEETNPHQSSKSSTNSHGELSSDGRDTSCGYNSPVSSHKLFNLGLAKLDTTEDEGKTAPVRSPSRLRESRHMHPPDSSRNMEDTENTSEVQVITSKNYDQESLRASNSDSSTYQVSNLNDKNIVDELDLNVVGDGMESVDSIVKHGQDSAKPDQGTATLEDSVSKPDQCTKKPLLAGVSVKVKSLPKLGVALEELRLLDKFPQLREARRRIACREIELSDDGKHVKGSVFREINSGERANGELQGEQLELHVPVALGDIPEWVADNVSLYTGDVSLLQVDTLIVFHPALQSNDKLVNSQGHFDVNSLQSRMESLAQGDSGKLLQRGGPGLDAAYSEWISNGSPWTITNGHGLPARSVMWVSLPEKLSSSHLCESVKDALCNGQQKSRHDHVEERSGEGKQTSTGDQTCRNHGTFPRREGDSQSTLKQTNQRTFAVSLYNSSSCDLTESQAVCATGQGILEFLALNKPGDFLVVLSVQNSMQHELSEQFFTKVFRREENGTHHLIGSSTTNEGYNVTLQSEDSIKMKNKNVAGATQSEEALQLREGIEIEDPSSVDLAQLLPPAPTHTVQEL